jgi:lipoprotein-anchoring transpeptidase ErfK/SrfK
MTRRRVARIAALALIACLIAGAASMVVVGSQRRSTFDAQVASLQRAWAHDLAVGVPSPGITPLESRLRKQRPQDEWWAPVWWTTDGQGLMAELTRATASAYAAAMATQRARAQLVLNDWEGEAGQDQSFMTATELAAGRSWTAQLSAATTPDQIADLAVSWQAQLDADRTAIAAAQQQATLQADVAAAGGPAGLISQAGPAISKAGTDDLDPGDVPALVKQLQTEESGGADPGQTAELLYVALQQLNQLIALNNQLHGEMRPLMLLVDQAGAEGTPTAQLMLAQYQTVDQDYLSGTTIDQLTAVQAAVTSLQARVTDELAANQCGHDVGSGKVITLNLTLQEGVFYDDGCVVKATPITTGRPGLRTPTGNFSVFYKTSPFTMVSPWPLGSPDWYPTTVVQWVLEFADGYFLHDAYWENQNAFGPGSENDVAQDWASHGCVHIPTALMPWLYDWTPLGTPVIITN